MILELNEIQGDVIDGAPRCTTGQFHTFLRMATKSLQVGNYGEAEEILQKANQQWTIEQLNGSSEAHLLTLQIHLAWYRRGFSEALEKAQNYLRVVERGPYRHEQVGVRILLGNLYRDAGQLCMAHFWYAEAQKCIEEFSYSSYTPWVAGQLAWLYLLEGRFVYARLQIEMNRNHANQSQAMQFQVVAAILEIFDGDWEYAENLLTDALVFYEQADDPLACCALHFYLAYNALQQHALSKFLAHANYAFEWLTEHHLTAFPCWWHPKIIAEVCTHTLMSDLYPTLIEQILVHHIGYAALPALTRLGNVEDIDLRRKVNQLHRAITGIDTNPLAHLKDTPSKRVLCQLVESGMLRIETYARLEQELMTATLRPRPNATIIAVFGLYINGAPREEIAEQLACSIENVRNYITAIYQHFALPAYRYTARDARRQKLIEVARERGYIY